MKLRAYVAIAIVLTISAAARAQSGSGTGTGSGSADDNGDSAIDGNGDGGDDGAGKGSGSASGTTAESSDAGDTTLADIKDGKLARYGITAGAGVVANVVFHEQTDHVPGFSAMPYIEVLPGLLAKVRGHIARSYCVAKLTEGGTAQSVADKVALTDVGLESATIEDISDLSVDNTRLLTRAIFGDDEVTPTSDVPSLASADERAVLEAIRDEFSTKDENGHRTLLDESTCNSDGKPVVVCAALKAFLKHGRLDARGRVQVVLAAIDGFLAKKEDDTRKELENLFDDEMYMTLDERARDDREGAEGSRNRTPAEETLSSAQKYERKAALLTMVKLVVYQRTRWWLGIPAKGCGWRVLGLYVGLPGKFSVNSDIGTSDSEETKGTRVATDFTPKLSLGLALNFTSFVQLLIGVTWAEAEDKNKSNTSVFTMSFGIGGNLDIFGPLFGK